MMLQLTPRQTRSFKTHGYLVLKLPRAKGLRVGTFIERGAHMPRRVVVARQTDDNRCDLYILADEPRVRFQSTKVGGD